MGSQFDYNFGYGKTIRSVSNPAREFKFRQISLPSSPSLMTQISLAISNPITSLPCGVDMINKLHNVLPKNVRHLQCGKVSSLKRDHRQPLSREEGRFTNITLSCALKKETFPVASAQLFGTLASSSGNHEAPNGFLILSMLPDTARSLAVGPTILMRFNSYGKCYEYLSIGNGVTNLAVGEDRRWVASREPVQ